MANKSNLINEIAIKSTILATENEDADISEDEIEIFMNEYRNQLESFEHNQYLRSYIGYEIEKGNKDAIEIMKLIIKYNLMMLEEVKRL